MKTRAILVTTDILILSCSFLLSHYWFAAQIDDPLILCILFLAVKLIFFVKFGLYNAILKFAGMPLAATMIKAITAAQVLLIAASHILSSQSIPIGFFIADFLITAFLVGLVRFAPRYFSEAGKSVGSKRVLIYGAGELGVSVAEKLIRSSNEYRLLGFLDDRDSKIGKRIHNLPVYGSRQDVSAIVAKLKVSEVIVAIASITGQNLRQIARECHRNGVICRIVPSFPDMMKKDVSVKNIDIKDLLKRKPNDLDEVMIKKFIKDRAMLITGAGGSIGAEMARQCIKYGARKLVLVDQSEYNLYSLQEELESSNISIRYCLSDVLCKESLEKIFSEERPSIVFHAAAYKHVPIVEDNVFTGVKNNVQGTINVAELAQKYDVEKFVLISTDKAVRPSSVMGASKRVAELYVQNMDPRGSTEFIAVRFGNVLASSGSVIPKFIEQINEGGPVTVTHPDVTRYFMLINEAVQLVLQAASIGHGGEIFILNMGSPIRISEMAEDLIFLAGRQPHKDIKILYTGLRPGEKLYEELLIDETEKKTQYENITIGRAIYLDWGSLKKNIQLLSEAIETHNRGRLLNTLRVLVPEFAHESFEGPLKGAKVVALPLPS